MFDTKEKNIKSEHKLAGKLLPKSHNHVGKIQKRADRNVLAVSPTFPCVPIISV